MMKCRHNCNLFGKMAEGSDGVIQYGDAFTIDPNAESTKSLDKKLLRLYKESSLRVVKNVEVSSDKQQTDWSTSEQKSSRDTYMSTSNNEVNPPSYCDLSVHGDQSISGKITDFLRWSAWGSDLRLKNECDNNKDINKSLNLNKSKHRLFSGQNEYGYEFHRYSVTKHKFSIIFF